MERLVGVLLTFIFFNEYLKNSYFYCLIMFFKVCFFLNFCVKVVYVLNELFLRSFQDEGKDEQMEISRFLTVLKVI